MNKLNLRDYNAILTALAESTTVGSKHQDEIQLLFITYKKIEEMRNAHTSWLTEEYSKVGA